MTVKKSQANVIKCAKKKSWVPRNPPGHLSVKLGGKIQHGVITYAYTSNGIKISKKSGNGVILL